MSAGGRGDEHRSLGYVSAVDSNGRTIWIADAHRGDGKRFVVRADERLTGAENYERDAVCHIRGTYHSLKSPVCSCVSIMLPEAS
jgi:hypothetical protein